MIDSVSYTGENLVINKGEGSAPSPPPSSAKTSSSSDAAQPAVDVELSISQEVAQHTQAGTVNDNARQLEQAINSEAEKSPREQDLEQELKEAIESLNDKLSRLDREILFKLDKRINRNYISVVDKQSKEIIREFPPEEIRTFIARFDEFNEKLNMSTDIKSLIINLEV
jgi:flagellar protein FlaG